MGQLCSTPYTPLTSEVLWGTLKTVRKLLEEGEDPNQSDDYGWSPLTSAAGQEGHLKIVSLLIEYGADVNAQDDNGSLPISQSLTLKSNQILSLLIETESTRWR